MNKAVFVVVAVFFAVGPVCAEQQHPKPNVLFLCVDDMKDWVNCLGAFDIYERKVLARRKWFPYLGGTLPSLFFTGEPRRCCTLESINTHSRSQSRCGMRAAMSCRRAKGSISQPTTKVFGDMAFDHVQKAKFRIGRDSGGILVVTTYSGLILHFDK